MWTRCRSLVAPCLALTIALGQIPAHAAPAASDFEQLLAEADGHAFDGDHVEALEDYEGAYAAMPIELRTTGVGEIVALAAGKAALEDYASSGTVESLERGRALLATFIEDVSTRGDASSPSVDAAKVKLDEIEAALADANRTPPPAPDVGGAPEPSTAASSGEVGWVWGRYRPRPRWKWAMFGLSTGLTALGAGGVVLSGDYLARGFRDDLLQAAADSESSPNEFNRVPTTLPSYVDLCEYNSHDYDVIDGVYTKGEPLVAPDGSLGARDVEVGRVCNRGEDVVRYRNIAAIFMGVHLASMAVFTTLLFVHKGPKRKQARAWRRHGMALGLGASRGRGATLQLLGRF